MPPSGHFCPLLSFSSFHSEPCWWQMQWCVEVCSPFCKHCPSGRGQFKTSTRSVRSKAWQLIKSSSGCFTYPNTALRSGFQGQVGILIVVVLLWMVARRLATSLPPVPTVIPQGNAREGEAENGIISDSPKCHMMCCLQTEVQTGFVRRVQVPGVADIFVVCVLEKVSGSGSG